MEEYDMSKVWRDKLAELHLQRKLMSMDKQFTEEEINDLDEMIKSVKKEYAKALREEMEEEKENGKSR